MDLIIFFAAFIILMGIGAPIYLSLIIPSILYIFLNPGLPMLIMSQKMLVSMNSFPLMAVPFFILAGQLMNTSSVTDRIFGFAKSLVGHFSGGLGYVNILSSVIFSGMSGSAVADVGGLGQVEIKAMRDAGYDDAFTIGVTAASGTIGPIIPPSIPFVVIGSLAGVSVGALFMGGIIPGLLMATILGIMVFILSIKRKYPREKRETLGGLWRSLKRSFLALLLPVFIIGGIWTGWFTPTEAALASIVYALILSLFVYRDVKIKKFPSMLLESAKIILPVMMIIVGATLFSWILSYEKLDQQLLNLLTSFTQNKYIILLLINVIVLIMGCFFDPIVTYMLLVPIALPICATYGISMIHVCIIIVIGAMIGLLTPPVGMSLFILSSMTKYPVGKLARWVMPWMIPLIITLLLITFFDWFVMVIPRSMGLGL